MDASLELKEDALVAWHDLAWDNDPAALCYMLGSAWNAVHGCIVQKHQTVASGCADVLWIRLSAINLMTAIITAIGITSTVRVG
jgi:hypothetical protein